MLESTACFCASVERQSVNLKTSLTATQPLSAASGFLTLRGKTGAVTHIRTHCHGHSVLYYSVLAYLCFSLSMCDRTKLPYDDIFFFLNDILHGELIKIGSLLPISLG